MPFQSAADALAEKVLFANIWGQEKRGKTSLALSFPRPLYYFNFDYRFKALLQEHPEWRRDMQIASYIVPPSPQEEEAEAILDQFLADYEDALNDPKGGTVCIDTATQLWELIGYVKVGQVMQKRLKLAEQRFRKNLPPGSKADFDPDSVLRQQFDWGPANAMMSAILRCPRENPKLNAAYVNRGRERFDERGGATGTYQFHGFKGTAAIVDVNLEMTMNGSGKNAQMVAKVGTSIKSEYEGMSFPGLTYDDLVEMFLGGDDD